MRRASHEDGEGSSQLQHQTHPTINTGPHSQIPSSSTHTHIENICKAIYNPIPVTSASGKEAEMNLHGKGRPIVLCVAYKIMELNKPHPSFFHFFFYLALIRLRQLCQFASRGSPRVDGRHEPTAM